MILTFHYTLKGVYMNIKNNTVTKHTIDVSPIVLKGVRILLFVLILLSTLQDLYYTNAIDFNKIIFFLAIIYFLWEEKAKI